MTPSAACPAARFAGSAARRSSVSSVWSQKRTVAMFGSWAVLLEEHPLQDLRPLDAVRRQQRRAVGEVAQDGVRFREAGAVLQLEGGDAPVRVAREERRRAGLATHDV